MNGLVKSLQGLFWVLFLLFAEIYIFAVFFTMVVNEEDYGIDFQQEYFSDMAHSMMTLLNIAILAEWGEIVRPVLRHQPMLLPCFIVFVFVSSFAMLNVMIGIICDNISEARKELENNENEKQLEKARAIWDENIYARGLGQEHIRQSAN